MSPADMMVCSPGSPDNQTMVIDECTPVQKVDESQPTIILQSSMFESRKQLNTNLFGSHNFLEDDTDQQSKEMDFTMYSCSTGHDDTIMEGNSLVGNTLNFDTPEVAAPDGQFNDSNPPKSTSAPLQRHPSNVSDNNTVVIQIGKRNICDTARRASSSSVEPTTTFNTNINTSSTKIREVVPASHTKSSHRESGDGKAFFINGTRYSRVKLVGRGGSSKVYKVLDSAGNVFALKRIKMKNTSDSAMANQKNEINLLRKLSGKPGIIRLVDAHINIASKTVSVVMEFGETDLNKYVKAKKNKLSLDEVRGLWQQMLEAVQTIHEGRVIHGDLKPANFLFVDGKMKLIDFGISKEIGNDTEHIGRDTQVGTLNFMAPEALRDAQTNDGKTKVKLGRSSDVWSLGCILYQLVYGHAPFSTLSLYQKLQAIMNPKHEIKFPPVPGDDSKGCLEQVLRSCLSFKPNSRPPILGPNGLLSHRFLTRAEPAPATIRLSRGDLQRVIRQACAAIQRCSTNSLLKWVSDDGAMDRFMTRFTSEGVVLFDVPHRQRGRTGESPALKKSKPSISQPTASQTSRRLSGGGAARARLDSTLQNAIKNGKLKKRKKRKSLRSKQKQVETPKQTSVQTMLDRRRAFMGLSPTGTDTDSDWTLYTELLQ